MEEAPKKNISSENNSERYKNEIGNDIKDFIILKILSKSDCGLVVKVKSKKNQKIYAMKVSKLNLAKNIGKFKNYNNQLIFLKNLNHENICKYYTHFEDKENNILYIIMEYIDNGNFLTLKETFKSTKEEIINEKLLKIFLDCMDALTYLHSKGVMHRDIKLENFVLDNRNKAKIIDFKMAAIENHEKAKNFSSEEHLDTVNHKYEINNCEAPELKNESNNLYSFKSDVYLMGIVFCNLAYLSETLPEKKGKNEDIYDIIKKMLKQNPEERSTSSEIFDDLKDLYCRKYLSQTAIISSLECLSQFKPPSFNPYNVIKNTLLEQYISYINKRNNSNNKKDYNICLFNFIFYNI